MENPFSLPLQVQSNGYQQLHDCPAGYGLPVMSERMYLLARTGGRGTMQGSVTPKMVCPTCGTLVVGSTREPALRERGCPECGRPLVTGPNIDAEKKGDANRWAVMGKRTRRAIAQDSLHGAFASAVEACSGPESFDHARLGDRSVILDVDHFCGNGYRTGKGRVSGVFPVCVRRAPTRMLDLDGEGMPHYCNVSFLRQQPLVMRNWKLQGSPNAHQERYTLLPALRSSIHLDRHNSIWLAEVRTVKPESQLTWTVLCGTMRESGTTGSGFLFSKTLSCRARR